VSEKRKETTRGRDYRVTWTMRELDTGKDAFRKEEIKKYGCSSPLKDAPSQPLKPRASID